MANEQTTPERVEHPAGAPAAPHVGEAAQTAQAAPDGTRTAQGSNYGDFAPGPARAAGSRDPSRGAELERDALPPDADFSRRPELADVPAHAPPPAAAAADPDADPDADADADADQAAARARHAVASRR